MADRELKKLSRAELIDIIYALKEREESLSNQVASLQEALSHREIQINQAGSIAEAALKINQVFEKAQKAADDYLLSLHLAVENGTLEPQTPPIPEQKPEQLKEEPKPEKAPEFQKLNPQPHGAESRGEEKSHTAPPEDRSAQARQKFETKLSGLICRTEKGGDRR